ncbi:MAG: hypothetical protein ABW136_03750 [Steroidobacteraceae bacterium]
MNTVVDAGHIVPAGRGAEESFRSAVSWAAIIAGAIAAAALTLILLMLGAGLGFASLSPWAQSGVPAATVGVATAIGLWLVQVISSGLGGYLTGRLRTRWVDLHTDEVRFRDTAHGLVAWALAAILGVGVLGSAAASLVGAAGSAAGQVVTSVATTAAAAGAGAMGSEGGLSTDYLSDVLLRSDSPPSGDATPGEEIGRLLTTSFAKGEVTADDKAYLAKLVARHAGIDEAQAQQRVDQVLAQAAAAKAEAERMAKEAADAARKGAALLSLWVFICLLSGAFASSAMAAYGGRLRDEVALVPTR